MTIVECLGKCCYDWRGKGDLGEREKAGETESGGFGRPVNSEGGSEEEK